MRKFTLLAVALVVTLSAFSDSETWEFSESDNYTLQNGYTVQVDEAVGYFENIPYRAVVDASTVLLLRFNETAGVMAYDASGNGNDALAASVLFGGSGVFDDTCVFVPKSGYVAVPADATLDVTAELLIDCWFRYDSIPGTRTIARRWGDSESEQAWRIEIVDGTPAVTFRNTNAVATLEASGQVSPGSWHHIGISYQQGGDLGIYLDSVLSSTMVVGAYAVQSVTESIYVGASGTSNNGSWVGIDEFRIRGDEAERWYSYEDTASQSYLTINSASCVYATSLSAFSETVGTGNTGLFEYQVTLNNRAYYWTGVAWARAASLSNRCSATEINANAATFCSSVGYGKVGFRVFAISNGVQYCALDRIALTYAAGVVPTPTAPWGCLLCEQIECCTDPTFVDLTITGTIHGATGFVTTKISDGDGDTSVDVESATDCDTIDFTADGVSTAKFEKNRANFYTEVRAATSGAYFGHDITVVGTGTFGGTGLCTVSDDVSCVEFSAAHANVTDASIVNNLDVAGSIWAATYLNISAGETDNIHDADNDTKVTTELNADEDIVRVFAGGNLMADFDNTELTVFGDVVAVTSAVVAASASISEVSCDNLSAVGHVRAASGIFGTGTVYIDDAIGVGVVCPVVPLDVRGAVNVGKSDNSEYYDVNFYATGAGARFFFDSSKRAMRIGDDSDGTHWNDANMGWRSFAFGNNCIAQGSNSIAGGYISKATHYNSVAIGYDVEAIGNNAVAFGNRTTASGDNSIAMGWSGIASGDQSVCLGQGGLARGDGSACLHGHTASGQGAIAIGVGSKAISNYDIAIGNSTRASGGLSLAAGSLSFAKGVSSVAMGYAVCATGDYATALGYYTSAGGTYSFALGREIDVRGNYSVGIALNDQNDAQLSDNNTMAIMGGEVGIGTLSPGYVLDVSGTIGANTIVSASASITNASFEHITADVGTFGTATVVIDDDIHVASTGNVNFGLSACSEVLLVCPTCSNPGPGIYTTIQDALDAASAGALVKVEPGTYTDETINFTANNQTVRGMGLTPNQHVTTADARICNFGAYTGCRLENIKLSLTNPTTAKAMIEGWGDLKVRWCHFGVNCSQNIATAAQPSVIDTTGSFTMKFGTIDYDNTGSQAGSYKAPILIGGSADLDLVRVAVNVDCTGTAFATTVVYGDSTGETGAYRCKVAVNDASATFVIGLAYLTGSNSPEFIGNVLHVTGGTNTAYGAYFTSGTAMTPYSIFNHVHVLASGGTARSALVGNNVTLTSQLDSVVAAGGYQTTGSGQVVYANSQSDGCWDISDDLVVGDSVAAASASITDSSFTNVDVSNDFRAHGECYFMSKTVFEDSSAVYMPMLVVEASAEFGTYVEVGTDIIGDASTGLYFGEMATNGSWRLRRSGDNLVFERREAGVWVIKQTITP